MKKILLAVLLGVTLFSMSSCENEEPTQDDIISIIEDEVTWNEAFENLDFENFTAKDEKKNESIMVYVSKTGIYGKATRPENLLDMYLHKDDSGNYFQYQSMIYIQQKENQTYYNEYTTLAEAEKNRKWEAMKITQEEYEGCLRELVLEIFFQRSIKILFIMKTIKVIIMKG